MARWDGVSEASRAQAILRSCFGFDGFRPGQEELVTRILLGGDCLGVMPTGAGKSLCYQVPAMAFAFDAEGDEAAGAPNRDPAGLAVDTLLHPAQAMTLIVSPLVSLMSDQVMALRSTGIPAAYLNSRLTPPQQEEVLARAAAGAYALMYVAPERLSDRRFLAAVGARITDDADGDSCEMDSYPYDYQSDAFFFDNPGEYSAAAFSSPAIPISFVAVDEAHCVSQWGQDFRPSYLRIAQFINSLPTRPVVAAFTATATPKVADDIVRLLGLQDPLRVTTGFDRPNLHFSVEQLSDSKKMARVIARAQVNPSESGIVYCSTRKDVEAVHAALLKAGVRATRYHAGLAHGEREANQRAFVNDDAPVMVATNAFGMGIDKSNVRYVIHFNMPGSLEAYYQEAGRAGRDGEPADCELLWSDADIATCRFFIEQESGNEALSAGEQQVVRASQRRRLATMTNYCMTCDCLRQTILCYFGEAQDDATLGASPCGNCSNCDGDVDAVDVTRTARSVMRCVHELRGRFGKGIVTDVLRGSDSAKMREYGLMGKKTYGIVDDSAATVKEIIELLTAGEYLEISEGRYPLVGLGPRAREAATDEFRLYMKRRRKSAPKASARASRMYNPFASDSSPVEGGPSKLASEEHQALFERLRRLRKRLADEEGVPPYIVFSDAALHAMCRNLPSNEDEFLAVPGVGPVKLKRYGRAFLDEINE